LSHASVLWWKQIEITKKNEGFGRFKAFVNCIDTFSIQVNAIWIFHSNRMQLNYYSKYSCFLRDEGETRVSTYSGMNRVSGGQGQDISTRDYPRAFSFNKPLYCVNETKASECKIWNRVLFSLIAWCWVHKHWSITTLKFILICTTC